MFVPYNFLVFDNLPLKCNFDNLSPNLFNSCNVVYSDHDCIKMVKKKKKKTHVRPKISKSQFIFNTKFSVAIFQYLKSDQIQNKISKIDYIANKLKGKLSNLKAKVGNARNERKSVKTQYEIFKI